MAYNNWNIPSDLFSIRPVNRDTINNFIGRDSQVRRIRNQIEAKNIIVVFEGEVGTGKTSLGNYIRFTQENAFTTDIEIMCQAHWQSREFLLALQSALITTCKKNPDLKELFNIDIFKRLQERNSNIRISNYQIGISVLGSGLNGGNAESIAQPLVLDDQTLIDELAEIINHIKDVSSKFYKCNKDSVRLIFQINNLDPSEPPFSDESVVAFLNSIRDVITDKIDASFIVNGATGLLPLITKRVKRLAPCVIMEKVNVLSSAELVQALNRRIENSANKGQIPFEEKLIEDIYNSTNGNFRQTLGIMEELSIYYDNEEPLMGNITEKDCLNYYVLQYGEEVRATYYRKDEVTNKGKILKALVDNPMMNVSELGNAINIQQGNVSKLLSELESDGIIQKVRDLTSTRCLIVPHLYFATKALKLAF